MCRVWTGWCGVLERGSREANEHFIIPMSASEQIAAALGRRGEPHNFLWLKGYGLKTLPPEVFEFEDLEFLDLEDNQLTCIPDEIAKVKNLQMINVARNRLTEFPESLLKLVKLREIVLSHNQIERMPDACPLGELALEYLDMSNNRLREIPSLVFSAPRLRIAHFDSNQIQGVDLRKIRKLRCLDALGLNRNPCYERLPAWHRQPNCAGLEKFLYW